MSERSEEAALRALHPLYIEMRNAELAADNPQLEQIRIMAGAVADDVGRPLDHVADRQELRRLVACMRAFNRIEMCRHRFPLTTGRRQSLGDVLDKIADHSKNLDRALRKLLDDTIRDTYAGAPIDVERLKAVRSLFLAMGRGWLHDIDPGKELIDEVDERMRDTLPSFSLADSIPKLNTSLKSLEFLAREAKAIDRNETAWAPSVNRGRDAFVLDVAAIFRALTGKNATAWDRAGTEEQSGFFRFLSTVWHRLEDVPIEGHAVHRGGCPNARTVKRILDTGK